MKKIISIAFVGLFGLLLVSCDPKDGDTRSIFLTSPNGGDARQFQRWDGGNTAVSNYSGIQVIAQTSGTELLMTCPAGEALLPQQSSVNNGSTALKTCNVSTGCSATFASAIGDGSSGSTFWTSQSSVTVSYNNSVGTFNNVNNGGTYTSAIYCVKTDDLSKWR